MEHGRTAGFIRTLVSRGALFRYMEFDGGNTQRQMQQM